MLSYDHMFMPPEDHSFHPKHNAYGASNNSTSDFNILVTRVKVCLWLFKKYGMKTHGDGQISEH